jgi:hypothetical protein
MAKNKHSKEKKRKKRLKKLKERSARTQLLNRATKTIANSDKEVLVNPSGETKMSEVLLDFADPLLQMADEESEERNIMEMAILAWNLALLPLAERQELLSTFVDDSLSDDGTSAEEIAGLIEWLVDRKIEYYIESDRFIVDYEFVGSGNRRRLYVVSTK